MLLRKMNSLVGIALALTLAGPATAAPVYDEAADGDFSGIRAAPTHVNFTPGQNDVFGQTGRFSGVSDLDYFTFEVPANTSLVSLVVIKSALAAGRLAFLGLQAGGVVTVDPAAPDASLLLGYKHTSPADIGIDILPAIGTGAGAAGFTPPLGAGQYSVWIQDTSPGASLYGLRFVVPEPGTVLLVLAGIAALTRSRRRQP